MRLRPSTAGRDAPVSLREQAEALAGEATPVDSCASTAALVHELQVHKIELEMQNAALHAANAALEESRRRYLDRYDRLPVGYLTLTSGGIITEVNPAGARLFAVPRSRALKRPFAAFLTAADADRWHRFLSTLVRRGGKDNAEFELVHNTGPSAFVRVDGLRVRQVDKIIAVHVTLTDVSDRKQAEFALREQEAFFRLIAENIDGFIAVVDLDGRRIYNNPSYSRLLGERDIAGTDSFLNVHPDDRERVHRAFSETIASGVGQRLEYRFMMPDGGVRLMESRGGVMADSDGKVKRVVVVSNDITDRDEADRKIHHLAFYDPLTQLPNRQTLNDRLGQAIAASNRDGRYGALMFLDLDNFKAVNDRHGHGTGDELLIQAADRLTGCVREIDTVARYGGDEFIVLLGELNENRTLSLAQAERVAEKIRDALADDFILEIKGKDGPPAFIGHRCTASIGVTLFLKREHTEEKILQLADIAMYRAKEAGRNRICFSGAGADPGEE